MKTELDHDFEYADDETFTRTFWKDIAICVLLGFLTTIGILAVVVNAEKIDAFFTSLAKSIFL